MNIEEYVDEVVGSYNISFASEIVEKYALHYIKEYVEENNDGKKIIVILGNLAFLYRNDEISNEKIKNFINELFKECYSIDGYLAKRIANFIEIILNKNSELVYFYIDKIKSYTGVISDDSMAILYKATIIPAFKNELNVYEIADEFQYPWRSYYEIAFYNYYYHNKMMALQYINKAIATCPRELLEKYMERKKFFRKSM